MNLSRIVSEGHASDSGEAAAESEKMLDKPGADDYKGGLRNRFQKSVS
jgi:hypothetical protein